MNIVTVFEVLEREQDKINAACKKDNYIALGLLTDLKEYEESDLDMRGRMFEKLLQALALWLVYGDMK